MPRLQLQAFPIEPVWQVPRQIALKKSHGILGMRKCFLEKLVMWVVYRRFAHVTYPVAISNSIDTRPESDVRPKKLIRGILELRRIKVAQGSRLVIPHFGFTSLNYLLQFGIRSESRLESPYAGRHRLIAFPTCQIADLVQR